MPELPSQSTKCLSYLPHHAHIPGREKEKKKSLVEAAPLIVFPEGLPIDFHLLITDQNHVTWPAVVARESGKN